jgi:hypothetical protein
MIKIMQIEMMIVAVIMHVWMPLVVIAIEFVWMVHARHMVQHKLRFNHVLHPRVLEWSMCMLQTWQCIIVSKLTMTLGVAVRYLHY